MVMIAERVKKDVFMNFIGYGWDKKNPPKLLLEDYICLI
jgi:hypothetical protein